MALLNAFGAIALDATVTAVKTATDAVKTAVDQLKTAVTDGTLRGTVTVANPTTAVDVTSLPEVEVKNDIGNPLTVVGTVTADVDSRFKRLLKFEPAVGEELRSENLDTDRYHGAAPDGTATSSATWDVVRFYKDASKNIVRVRFRSGVAWDDRAAGWV